MTPDKILDTIDFQSEEDSKLLYAVMAYCHASAIEEKRFDGPYDIFNLGSIISKCVTNLLDRSGHKFENGTYISVINQSLKTADICKCIEAAKVLKEIGNTLRTFAEFIRVLKPKLTLSHLELIVNARKYNKRLPK